MITLRCPFCGSKLIDKIASNKYFNELMCEECYCIFQDEKPPSKKRKKRGVYMYIPGQTFFDGII